MVQYALKMSPFKVLKLDITWKMKSKNFSLSHTYTYTGVEAPDVQPNKIFEL